VSLSVTIVFDILHLSGLPHGIWWWQKFVLDSKATTNWPKSENSINLPMGTILDQWKLTKRYMNWMKNWQEKN